MKKALAISNILSWVNLIVGSILVLIALLTLVALPMAAVLLSVVLIGCIVLHSYAAMQLHKSILNPAIPLNKQTPVGIRMMGYMALFFAVLLFSNAFLMLNDTEELLKQVQLPPKMKMSDFTSIIRGTGIFILLFSLSVFINVIFNFRLMKIYMSANNNEIK